ncbi:hypothetical protein ACFL6E_07640 [Candidatus Neomarinimicrobiota bacterium]
MDPNESSDINDIIDHKSDQLFIYQGAYDALGTVAEIAELIALHDIAVMTHGFYLDGSAWINGSCLDVNYASMPTLLAEVRALNPEILIFGYVPATADHPNGCWPIPSIVMEACPTGECADFKTWTDLWLSFEDEAIQIDGIFIDLVHPALIGESVRDSVFSYIKSKGKLIMANALSDTAGLTMATESPYLTETDYLLVEGYHTIAGSNNVFTPAINNVLAGISQKWVAISSEYYNAAVSCSSSAYAEAYAMFQEHGGSAFTYQAADLGGQSGSWIYCDRPPSEIE